MRDEGRRKGNDTREEKEGEDAALRSYTKSIKEKAATRYDGRGNCHNKGATAAPTRKVVKKRMILTRRG